MSEAKWKGRNFLITLNEIEYFTEVKDYLRSLKNFNYAIACKEKAPTTGHIHSHIYCQFSCSTTLSKNKMKGAHIDKTRGTTQENINYVKKVDDPDKRGEIIWEEGTPKYKGGLTIKEVKNMTRTERENLPFVYLNKVERINFLEDNHIDPNLFTKDVEVRYIYGGSGLGKTFFATNWAKELNLTFDLVSFENGFWNGVSETCLFAFFDEFRDTCIPGVEFVKLIDYTIKNLNIKGGLVKNRYKYIAITSIQDPRFIYEKEWEEKKQWLRRMKVYHFFSYAQYKLLDSEELFN